MQIISNGSKWAGQPPDDVPTLLDVLTRHPLDPIFAGCTAEFGGTFRVSGNFLNLSHVFNIRGTLEEIHPIAQAMRKNRRAFWGKDWRQR